MDEFTLINTFFKSLTSPREDVIVGIGDDAACVKVPCNHHLLVSTDTLVSGVHFLESWDAYEIAQKALMVNISDMAAMAAKPCWVSLALTLPHLDETWLTRFAMGLKEGLDRYQISLIGGDTTHGPLSITLTIHGLVPIGKAVRRSGAKPGDIIYVSGSLGGAALAVLNIQESLQPAGQADLMKKLLQPIPRVDLGFLLQTYATAAIDISDGLGADLGHICEESHVGAHLVDSSVPIHPLVKEQQPHKAFDLALNGGDDYELCFTIPVNQQTAFLADLAKANITCYPIGCIETGSGLRITTENGNLVNCDIHGYRHF